VELVSRANGLPVLAHPPTASDLETLIPRLKASGLVGIEAHYNSYPADTLKHLIALAEQHSLIVTGGSDYHGIDATIETMIGGTDVPVEAAEQLITLAEQRALKLTT